MSEIVRWRRKPEVRVDRGVVAARYAAGGDLAAVREIAAMANDGEVAECPLPSGTVLLAAWTDVPDDHAPQTRYATVRDSQWLCFSDDYESLTASSDGSMTQWYEREPA